MHAPLATAILCMLVAPALAAEPDGCDKFKWPIERDRAALIAPDRAVRPSGSAPSPLSANPFTLELKPLDAASLPMPPERSRDAGRFAGFVSIAAPDKPGSYTLSMTTGVWIDVVQDGRYLKPTEFSGATGCDGFRKTMRFNIGAQPFVVQVSGSDAASVGLLLRPTD